jgi:hypothetical protein
VLLPFVVWCLDLMKKVKAYRNILQITNADSQQNDRKNFVPITIPLLQNVQTRQHKIGIEDQHETKRSQPATTTKIVLLQSNFQASSFSCGVSGVKKRCTGHRLLAKKSLTLF